MLPALSFASSASAKSIVKREWHVSLPQYGMHGWENKSWLVVQRLRTAGRNSGLLLDHASSGSDAAGMGALKRSLSEVAPTPDVTEGTFPQFALHDFEERLLDRILRRLERKHPMNETLCPPTLAKPRPAMKRSSSPWRNS